MLSMLTRCLVLLVYYFKCTNGANVEAITATVTNITKNYERADGSRPTQQNHGATHP